ncbi:hypothetical protein TSAR_002685 [Trichomalopsis sarcophagae]|uniref:Mutator-like transposase domain-containing protein n=1 Tax=Trichomalopsis sarcophagae TaxID=543379 RepID=A0A232EQ23_9HYME|nr:hypothetical protein TSAR_002685 [Trichomalopsis sarcophagae]
MDLNTASIFGLLVEGIGYTQMEELLADANRKEFELARRAGDIDENGNPFITVIVDGSWLTRSYGTKYDSLSGVGTIIGQKTEKVLAE